MDNNHRQERQHNSNHHHQHQQTEADEQRQQQLVLHGASTGRMEYSPGYRFCPTDEELIMSYLRPKIADRPLPFDGIPTLDINKHTPEGIKNMYKWSILFKENEVYFFTPRIRKYANGTRPDRRAPKGYWKPTGVEKCITSGSQIIGYKKQLDYYEGPSEGGKRSIWKMHEFRIDQTGPAPNRNANGEMNMQLDRFVLCRIYLSKRKKGDDDCDSYIVDNGEEEDAAESIMSPGDSGQTGQTNEAFVQNQNNNLVIPGPGNIARAFAWSSMYEPSNIYGENSSFIDQEPEYSIMNANNHCQAVQTIEAAMQNQNNNLVIPATSTSHAFAWPMAYKHTSSSQVFDQNSSFINQSYWKTSRDKHAGDSIMNANNYGQTVQTNEAVVQNLDSPAPCTSQAFAWPVSYKPTNDQNSSSFIDQSLQMFDQNSSFIHQRNRNTQEDAGDSIMNANNHGQSYVQTNDGVVQNQNNNLVSMVPSAPHAFAWPEAYKPSSSNQMFDQTSSPIGQSSWNSFQMFDPNSYLIGLSSDFNDALFPALENFPPPSSAVEPNYHPIMAPSDVSGPCMYMKPINSGDTDEDDLFDAVKDCKQPSCPSNSKSQ